MSDIFEIGSAVYHVSLEYTTNPIHNYIAAYNYRLTVFAKYMVDAWIVHLTVGLKIWNLIEMYCMGM